MRGVAVGSEAGGEIETGPAAGNHEQNAPRHDGSGDLRADVRRQVRNGKTFGHRQADGDGRIQMTAGNVADGISHGQDGEAERQGYAQQADTHVWKCGRQNGAAAAPEYKPECADELGDGSLTQRHGQPPFACTCLHIILPNCGPLLTGAGGGPYNPDEHVSANDQTK